MQNGTATLNTVWQFLTKLNELLLYHPESTLLGIYLNELNMYVHTKTYKGMFMVVLTHNCQNMKAAKIAFGR